MFLHTKKSHRNKIFLRKDLYFNGLFYLAQVLNFAKNIDVSFYKDKYDDDW
jgi:hypothetical protein